MMVGIITSKTRAKFSKSDKNRLSNETRKRLSDKHGVVSFSKPFGGITESQLVKKIESSSETKDRMEETRGKNQEKEHKRQLEFLKDQQSKAESISRKKRKEARKEKVL